MGCLYKLTSPSKKSYVGITLKKPEERWAKHVEHALGKRDNGALYSALRKYGPNTFSLEVLVFSDDWEMLCELEKKAIQEHKTLSPDGYNITLGGEGTQGKRSEKDRKTISVAQKKRFQRPDQIELMRQMSKRAAEKMAPIHAARRAKRELEHKAYLQSPEFKAMISKSIRDGLAKPEVREKVLRCAKERSQSAGWRAKISASKKGIKLGPCTEKRKRLISEARRREWSDPVIRLRRLAGLSKARASLAATRLAKQTT